jgi:hypothetical protein
VSRATRPRRNVVRQRELLVGEKGIEQGGMVGDDNLRDASGLGGERDGVIGREG